MITISITESTAAELRAVLAGIDLSSAPTVTPPAPPSTPPPTIVPAFVAAPIAAARSRMLTAAPFGPGPSFYSPGALHDLNVWLIGFNARAGNFMFSGSEYRGPITPRVWALVRNRDGVVLAQSTASQTNPAVMFGTTVSRFEPRIALADGERYTLNILNAQAGASSGMVGSFY